MHGSYLKQTQLLCMIWQYSVSSLPLSVMVRTCHACIHFHSTFLSRQRCALEGSPTSIQTLFSIVEMCQVFPMSFLPSIMFLLWVFSPDSCRASMNLNQTFISAPGLLCITIVYCMSFDVKERKKKPSFKPPVNGEWIVHVGECLTWFVTSLISEIIFLYQLAQAHPENVLHFLVISKDLIQEY